MSIVYAMAFVYAMPGGCPLPPGGPYYGLSANGTEIVSHMQEFPTSNRPEGCMVHTLKAAPALFPTEQDCKTAIRGMVAEPYPGLNYLMNPRWRCIELNQ